MKPINDKNYDRNPGNEEFCGSIPLNFINLIQPFGILVLLDKSYKVIQVSENISKILGKSLQDIVEQPFASLLAEGQSDSFQQKIERREVHNNIPHVFRLNTAQGSRRFAGVIHFHDEYFLLEFEPIEEETSDITFISAYQNIKYILAALQQTKDLREFGTIAASEIKAFSGFDRVMLYQFDQQWNGSVLAEAKEEDMEPYLNLKFPASDVPKQARELYLRTPYRIIPEVNFEPVKLFPIINPIVEGFTDISDCTLRSVPQVHIEYLKNMHVQASMSTPLIVDGKLWGLISCHHKKPKHIPFELRYAFEVLAGLISSQLASQEREERLLHFTSRRELELKLLDLLHREEEVGSSLLGESDILFKLFQAGGTALVQGEKYEAQGNVPSKKHVLELVKWLKLFNKEKLFVTDSLSPHVRSAKAYSDVASGLLAIQFSHSPLGYLLLFRPEIVHTINWGGNPNEAIQFEEDGKRYHPRNSFKKWREKVEYTAIPWEAELVEIAKNLRTVLLEKVLIDLQE